MSTQIYLLYSSNGSRNGSEDVKNLYKKDTNRWCDGSIHDFIFVQNIGKYLRVSNIPPYTIDISLTKQKRHKNIIIKE